MNLRFQKLHPKASIPTFAHVGDAGMDLTSVEDAIIKPGQRMLVSTGLAVAIPEGCAGLVIPRSGLAAKHGISVVNAPGLIDSGYRGELKVILLNTDATESFSISVGDRIAQLVIIQLPSLNIEEVDHLPENTERGMGGFGSTGI